MLLDKVSGEYGCARVGKRQFPCLYVGVQGIPAYDAVFAFRSELPQAMKQGITLSNGKLPDGGLDKILGVETEGTSSGSCLPKLVKELATQASATLKPGKAFTSQYFNVGA